MLVSGSWELAAHQAQHKCKVLDWCFRGQQGLPMLECCFALASRIIGLHGANMSCWGHWSAESSTNAGAAAQDRAAGHGWSLDHLLKCHLTK